MLLFEVRSQSNIHIYLLPFFLFFNSENDLEEVLTFYTQKNKSATVFLGTKVRSVQRDLHDASGDCENSKSKFLLCPPPRIQVTVDLVYVSYFIIQAQ